MEKENNKKSTILNFLFDIFGEMVGYALFSVFGIWIMVAWGTIGLVVPVLISLILIIRILWKKMSKKENKTDNEI